VREDSIKEDSIMPVSKTNFVFGGTLFVCVYLGDHPDNNQPFSPAAYRP